MALTFLVSRSRKKSLEFGFVSKGRKWDIEFDFCVKSKLCKKKSRAPKEVSKLNNWVFCKTSFCNIDRLSHQQQKEEDIKKRNFQQSLLESSRHLFKKHRVRLHVDFALSRTKLSSSFIYFQVHWVALKLTHFVDLFSLRTLHCHVAWNCRGI